MKIKFINFQILFSFFCIINDALTPNDRFTCTAHSACTTQCCINNYCELIDSCTASTNSSKRFLIFIIIAVLLLIIDGILLAICCCMRSTINSMNEQMPETKEVSQMLRIARNNQADEEIFDLDKIFAKLEAKAALN